MDQSGFEFEPTEPRIHAGIEPLGTWAEPCRVTCPCGFDELAPTCPAAQVLAAMHDRAAHGVPIVAGLR